MNHDPFQAGTVVCRERPGGDWLLFRRPVETLVAREAAGVADVLDRARQAVEPPSAGRRPLWAAGWVAYEAAPAFDPAFRTLTGDGDGPPAAWLGLYEAPERLARLPDPPPGEPFTLGPWRPAMDEDAYAAALGRIRRLIAAGDTYQVNFAYFHHGPFAGDPGALFFTLAQGGHGGLGALVVADHHAAVSTSPELFFMQEGDALTARPMKGTARRGRWDAEDAEAAARLAASAKDRAENVMIVDLLRNDMGRVARTGSVRAGPLFQVERYQTVLQMTSTITARTDADPGRTLAALFPCGSVTGAPKIRTMEIIAGLEREGRGIYTGTIGWMGPGRRACFNVAIRTLELDLERGRARYGVGGGITWYSDPAAERAETMAKIAVLTRRRPRFELFETMRWTAGEGFARLEGHLARLRASARYFDFPFDEAEARAALAKVEERPAHGAMRVRLLLAASGAARAESEPFEPDPPGRVRRLALAPEPVDSGDVFLFHKTTQREPYDRALAGHPDADDVLLHNERGELTESTIANVVLEIGGRRLTPPRESGLLGGVLREELLGRGEIRESVLKVADLARAEKIWLINSLRGWMAAENIKAF